MFFGSFWHAFGYVNNSSNLENILKQEGLTVETLLDTETIVNDIKQSQSKFITFLKQNSHFTSALIDYAIRMPDVDSSDDKQLYKYPFVASEILGTQIKGLEEIFFDSGVDSDFQDKDDSANEDADDDGEEEDQQQQDEDEEEDAADDETPIGDSKSEDYEDETKETPGAQETNAEKVESTETPSEETTEGSEKSVDSTEKSVEGEDSTLENKNDSEVAESQAETEEDAETPGSEETAAAPSAAPAAAATASDASKESSPKKKSSKANAAPKPKKYSGKDLLNQVLSFLDTTEPLNDTSAGYFLKAINNVLTTNGQFFTFILEKPNVLSQLISHIRTKSVSEVVLKLLTTVGSDSELESTNEQRKTLLNLLNERFSTGDSFERENIAHIVHEVISSFVQGENSYKATKCSPAVQQCILQEGFIETFFKVIVSPDADSSSVAYAATILNVLVTYYNSKNKQKNSTSGGNFDDEDVCNVTEEDRIVFPAQTAFETYLPTLIEFIQAPPVGLAHTTSYGANIVPFGVGKLKVVELVGHIFKSENKTLLNIAAKANVFQILLNVMVAFPWNNLVHVQIDKIVQEGIHLSTSGENEAVLNALLGRSFNLLAFIAEHSEVDTGKPGLITRDIRLGYIGFLTGFAKKLIEQTQCSSLTELKKGEEWTKYIQGRFQAISEQESQNLGGDNPKNKKEDEIEDPDKFDIDIQKIYEKFNTYFRSIKKDNNNDDKDQNALGDDDAAEPEEDITEEDGINDRKDDEDSEEEDDTDESNEHNEAAHDHADEDEEDEAANADETQPVLTSLITQATTTATKQKELQEEENFLDYAAHSYWKVQNHHNIDQLMDEL